MQFLPYILLVLAIVAEVFWTRWKPKWHGMAIVVIFLIPVVILPGIMALCRLIGRFMN